LPFLTVGLCYSAAVRAEDNVPPPGFTALFNGKDLTNWQGLVELPQRARLTKEQLAARQKEANEKILPHWTVRDGVLHYDGKGNSLQTIKDYGDFELWVDWKILADGDSGIYLRGSPQVQIWDPAKHPEGSGGLFNNQKNPSKPSKCADKPVGEWNRFRIVMRGPKVSVWLNGELVVDNVTMENYWDRKGDPSKPIPAVGPIELQHHGNSLEFKNIYVRQLASVAAGNGGDEGDGFVRLFNGKDLTGWRTFLDPRAKDADPKKIWTIQDGIIRCEGSVNGYLITEKDYENYVLRVQWRWGDKVARGRNSGVFVHVVGEDKIWPKAVEAQLMSGHAGDFWLVDNMKLTVDESRRDPKVSRHFLRCKDDVEKPLGEWNQYEITCKGDTVTLVINGQLVNEGTECEIRKGKILLQSEGAEIHFRNIELKPIE
jgi:hypothetical protein